MSKAKVNNTEENDKENQIESFLDKISIKPKKMDLYLSAFVHRSYLNENPNFKLGNNERLEFLGDAVLELSVTKYLFGNYNKPEGELTALRSALVRGKNLSDIASNLGLLENLMLSAGEKNATDKARGLILANTLEALIGAIYLDQGFDKTDDFINENIIKTNIKKIIKEKLYIDAKSEFQEKVQEKFKVTPRYSVLEQSGPDHDKIFISGVYVDEKMIAKAEGSSKNIAEQKAAEEALKVLFS